MVRYGASRGRKDLQLVLSFLTKQPLYCKAQDYMKLRRLMNYINCTLELKATIGAENLYLMHHFVNAAHGVHMNFRGHTGGVSTFGQGAIIEESKAEKLNATSTGACEIVGVSDYLPKMIFAYLFMEAQGYPIHNILWQDNESAIKLELNRRLSSSKRTRHIHLRLFYIKDLVDKKLVEIKFCPTLKMLADFFTKPLQGNLFRIFRDIILGYKPFSYLNEGFPSIKERVEMNPKSNKTVAQTVEKQPEHVASVEHSVDGKSGEKELSNGSTDEEPDEKELLNGSTDEALKE